MGLDKQPVFARVHSTGGACEDLFPNSYRAVRIPVIPRVMLDQNLSQFVWSPPGKQIAVYPIGLLFGRPYGKVHDVNISFVRRSTAAAFFIPPGQTPSSLGDLS